MTEPIRKCDGFDTCVIGHVVIPGTNQVRLIYDAERVIEDIYADLMSSRNLEDEPPTMEDAAEYFEFNVLGAYVGEGGPLFMWNKQWNEPLDEYVDGIEE